MIENRRSLDDELQCWVDVDGEVTAGAMKRLGSPAFRHGEAVT